MISSVDWQKPSFSQLSHQEAHVWRIVLTDYSDQLGSLKLLLDDNEKQTADRFHFKKDHDRYVVSHALLRKILARYLTTQPEQVKYANAPQGKPFLNHHAKIQFNLTHSGQVAICAICLDHELGVDVELIDKEVEYLELANRFFASAEAACLADKKGDLLKQAFFKIWTQKEAFVKAIGQGLSFSLKKFIVDADPGSSGGLISVDDELLNAEDWRLASFYVSPSYIGALAHNVEVTRTLFFDASMSVFGEV